MSNHVFVVSEWLPKKNHAEELWQHFKKLMALTLEKESGCLKVHATFSTEASKNQFVHSTVN